MRERGEVIKLLNQQIGDARPSGQTKALMQQLERAEVCVTRAVQLQSHCVFRLMYYIDGLHVAACCRCMDSSSHKKLCSGPVQTAFGAGRCT